MSAKRILDASTSSNIASVRKFYAEQQKNLKDPNLHDEAVQHIQALVTVIGKKEPKTGGALISQMNGILSKLTEEQAVKIMGYLHMDPMETSDGSPKVTDSHDHAAADHYAMITDKPGQIVPEEFNDEEKLGAIALEVIAILDTLTGVLESVENGEDKPRLITLLEDARKDIPLNPLDDSWFDAVQAKVTFASSEVNKFMEQKVRIARKEGEPDAMLQDANGLKVSFHQKDEPTRTVHIDRSRYITLAKRIGAPVEVKDLLLMEQGEMEGFFWKLYGAWQDSIKMDHRRALVQSRIGQTKKILEKLQKRVLDQLNVKYKKSDRRSKAISEANITGREVMALLNNAKQQLPELAEKTVEKAQDRMAMLVAIAEVWNLSLEGVEFFPLTSDISNVPGPIAPVKVLKKEEPVSQNEKPEAKAVETTTPVEGNNESAVEAPKEEKPVEQPNVLKIEVGLPKVDAAMQQLWEGITKLPDQKREPLQLAFWSGVRHLLTITDEAQRAKESEGILASLNAEVQEALKETIVEASLGDEQESPMKKEVFSYIPAVKELSSWTQWQFMRNIAQNLRPIYVEFGAENKEFLADLMKAKGLFQDGKNEEAWSMMGHKWMPKADELIAEVSKVATPTAINEWLDKAKNTPQEGSNQQEDDVNATITHEEEAPVEKTVETKVEVTETPTKKEEKVEVKTTTTKKAAKKAEEKIPGTFIGGIKARLHAFDACMAYKLAPKPEDTVIKAMLNNLFLANNGAAQVDLMSKTGTGPIVDHIKAVFGSISLALHNRESSWVGAYRIQNGEETITIDQLRTKLEHAKGKEKGVISAALSTAIKAAKADWEANQEEDKFITAMNVMEEFFADDQGAQKLLALSEQANFFIGRNANGERHITKAIATELSNVDHFEFTQGFHGLKDVVLSDKQKEMAKKLVKNVTDDVKFRAFMAAQTKVGLKLATVKAKFPKELATIKRYEDGLNTFRVAAAVIDRIRFGSEIFNEGKLEAGVLGDWKVNFSKDSLLQRDTDMLVAATKAYKYKEGNQEHHLPLFSDERASKDGQIAAYAVWYSVHKKAEALQTSIEWWNVMDSISNVEQLEPRAKKPHSRGFWKATGWVIYVAGRALFVGIAGLVSWIMRPVIALINAGKAFGYFIASKFSKEKATEYAAKAKESIGESWTNVKDIVMMPWRALTGLFTSIKAMWVSRSLNPVMVTGKGVIEVKGTVQTVQKEAVVSRTLSQYPFGDKTIEWKDQSFGQKAGTVATYIPRSIGKAFKAEPGAVIGATVAAAAVVTGYTMGMTTAVVAATGLPGVVVGAAVVVAGALVGWGAQKLFNWLRSSKKEETKVVTPATVPTPTKVTKTETVTTTEVVEPALATG